MITHTSSFRESNETIVLLASKCTSIPVLGERKGVGEERESKKNRGGPGEDM